MDTRAYINLKRAAFTEAEADYQAALGEDLRSSYTLLGAGISYARLGQMEKAYPLLQEGMAILSKEQKDHPDPQLADLVDLAQNVLEMTSSPNR